MHIHSDEYRMLGTVVSMNINISSAIFMVFSVNTNGGNRYGRSGHVVNLTIHCTRHHGLFNVAFASIPYFKSQISHAVRSGRSLFIRSRGHSIFRSLASEIYRARRRFKYRMDVAFLPCARRKRVRERERKRGEIPETTPGDG